VSPDFTTDAVGDALQLYQITGAEFWLAGGASLVVVTDTFSLKEDDQPAQQSSMMAPSKYSC
jgi:hypothetical protein